MRFSLKRRFIVKILACYIIILCANQLPTIDPKPCKKITIFVHGTLLPGLALLSPYKTYTNNLNSDDWYCKCIDRLRNNPLLQEDSIILEKGLNKIESDAILQYVEDKLPESLSKKGAYQAIGAYAMLEKSSKRLDETSNNDYYTFGFSGILSDFHRKEAGQELYKSIVNLVTNYKQQGIKTHINLCGYSHGGNVILYMAEAEKNFEQKLLIDNVILFGTPIQKETAHYALKPIFNKIINIYSQGDSIQNNDTFSTLSGNSYRKFGDILNTQNIKTICDVRLLAMNNPQAFGHFEFWFFDNYLTTLETIKSTEEIYNKIKPLPLSILTPIFLSLLDSLPSTKNTTDIDMSITIENEHTIIKAIDPKDQIVLAQSVELDSYLNNAKNKALTFWLPHIETNISNKLYLSLTAALQTLNA